MKYFDIITIIILSLVVFPMLAFGGLVVPLPGEGSGTVTSVTAGYGLTGGTVTIAGTVALNPAIVSDSIHATSTATSSYVTYRLGIGTTTPAFDLQVASSTGTSTIAIGWASTTAGLRSQVCWWNGENWTIEYYPSNSVTKNVATSTSCS